MSRLDTLTIVRIYSCQCVELLSRLVCRGVEVSCQELCRGVEAGALCAARRLVSGVAQRRLVLCAARRLVLCAERRLVFGRVKTFLLWKDHNFPFMVELFGGYNPNISRFGRILAVSAEY